MQLFLLYLNEFRRPKMYPTTRMYVIYPMHGMYKSGAFTSYFGCTGSSLLYLIDQSFCVKGNSRRPKILIDMAIIINLKTITTNILSSALEIFPF